MPKYSFDRKYGQWVKFPLTGDVGRIYRIEKYYTLVLTSKCTLAGTPTTIVPCDRYGRRVKG